MSEKTQVEEVQAEVVEEKVLEEFNEETTPSSEEENTVGETGGSDVDDEEDEESEVTLDDLDSVPQSEKFRVIGFNDKGSIPEVMTIANVKLGKAYEKDKDGNVNEPEENANGGRYYKAKLIVELAETINGDKIRTFVPSIFYSVDEDGSIAKIPSIPKACEDKKLDDNYTSSVAKVRNRHAKFVGKDSKDISSSEFVKGLIGLKFKPIIEEGEYKKKDWIKLAIGDFVK